MLLEQVMEMSDKEFALEPNMHIHLIGIGGSGMSAIAQVLQGRGFVVSGSDMNLNEITAVLQSNGATIYEGHKAEQIAGADVVVISSAIPETNPEVVAAKAQDIPVLKTRPIFRFAYGRPHWHCRGGYAW